MLIFRPWGDIPAPSQIAIDAPEGAIYCGDTLLTYSTGGHLRISGLIAGEDVTCLPLADLDVDKLLELVEHLDVDTAAQTASGLRRAIDRHLVG